MRLQPLEPRRVRKPRGAWGWIDLRAVTQGHLERVGTAAALTYLFLCSVGDTAGLSFWSRDRMGRILGLDGESIQKALSMLVDANLIARQGQIVQVLPIPEGTSPCDGSDSGSLKTSRVTPQETAHPGPSSSNHPSTTSRLPTLLEEIDVEPYLPQAREQMARLIGRRAPAESRVLALARLLAIKARGGCRG